MVLDLKSLNVDGEIIMKRLMPCCRKSSRVLPKTLDPFGKGFIHV